MENNIQILLFKLGLCDEESIELFYPKVRDRDDVAVMKCRKSGIIFLSRSDHTNLDYYKKKKRFGYWSAYNRQEAILNTLEDDQRRAKQFKNLIVNKKWLDVGTGAGGILDILSKLASETMAVELQEEVRNELLKCGYQVYSKVEEVPSNQVEIVTLFHVLEHLVEPIEILKTIAKKLMVNGGKIIIEVPHANDFLLSFLDLPEFKAFTFWSEHLILHTRQSLAAFLKEAGFKNIIINGYQRYPLANHLYWLVKRKPGGHQVWFFLKTGELDRAYSKMLVSLDKTDTLIAIAEKQDEN